MAEKIVAGPLSGANGVREAVCVHTKKIYASCKDKDCIEDLRFYPTQSAQSVLAAGQSIRGGRAELLYTFVDVEPVNFNRGFYTVDMRFYYRVVLQVMNGGMRYTEAEGLAAFDKRVVLYGSLSGAKVYSSVPVTDCESGPIDLSANLPIAVVEAVDPILLSARFFDACPTCPPQSSGVLTGVPQCILDAFGEPLVLDDAASRRVCVSLGQFSVVRLERDTQLLIPVYDYCIPSESCTIAGIGGGAEDPCAVFEDVEFPVDEFFPPNASNAGCGCGA